MTDFLFQESGPIFLDMSTTEGYVKEKRSQECCPGFVDMSSTRRAREEEHCFNLKNSPISLGQLDVLLQTLVWIHSQFMMFHEIELSENQKSESWGGMGKGVSGKANFKNGLQGETSRSKGSLRRI